MKLWTFRQFLAGHRAVRLLATSAGLMVGLSTVPRPATAATLYWDANGTSDGTGGTGAWNSSPFTYLWRNGSSTGTLQAWSDTTGKADTADFGGTAGIVTLGTNLGALGLVFESSGYTLATASFPVKLGTGGITAAGDTSITSTSGVNVTLVGAQAWNVTNGTLTVSSPTATGGFALSLTGAGNHTLSGIISGTGSIAKNSTGTLMLSAANTYSGGTTINAGTVTVSTSAALGTGAVAVNNANITAAGTAVVLNLSMGSDTNIGSLSGTVSVPTSGTNTVTINTQSGRNFGISQTAAGTFAGVIAGSGSISLVGASTNTLTLSGTNTYSGSTTVNGGTVSLTAAITGTSNVALNNSGTLALGANDRINNAATVTLNGGTLNTGGFQEGRATGVAAATQGLGALTLSANSTLDFGSGHAGSSVLAFANSASATWNGTLTLTDFTPGTDFLNFAASGGLTATQLGEISLSGFTVTGLDADGDVVFTAVPEPATWAAGALLVGMTGWHFRRRTVRRSA